MLTLSFFSHYYFWDILKSLTTVQNKAFIYLFLSESGIFISSFIILILGLGEQLCMINNV